MKNYCTSYYLFHVTRSGDEYPIRHAYSKSTLVKYAKKVGLSSFCISTIHTCDSVASIVRKDYYYD